MAFCKSIKNTRYNDHRPHVSSKCTCQRHGIASRSNPYQTLVVDGTWKDGDSHDTRVDFGEGSHDLAERLLVGMEHQYGYHGRRQTLIAAERKLISADRKSISADWKSISAERKLVSADQKLVSADQKLILAD